MAVEGYVGQPGKGKTYAMVSRALKLYKEKGHSTEIFSNIPLVGIRYTSIGSFDDLWGCQNGIVLLDELGVWMSSRDAMKLPAAVRAMLAQHRKNGLDLFWTAQSEMRVDTIIRELTNICWRVRKYPGLGIVCKGVDLFDPGLSYGWQRWPWSEEVYKTYDTAYIVGDPKTGQGARAGALRLDPPPVALRGCERVIEDPYGAAVVRWVKTDPNRGIILK